VVVAASSTSGVSGAPSVMLQVSVAEAGAAHAAGVAAVRVRVRPARLCPRTMRMYTLDGAPSTTIDAALRKWLYVIAEYAAGDTETRP
jgi:hypothetical protein